MKEEIEKLKEVIKKTGFTIKKEVTEQGNNIFNYSLECEKWD